jgi:hypothetical protein
MYIYIYIYMYIYYTYIWVYNVDIYIYIYTSIKLSYWVPSSKFIQRPINADGRKYIYIFMYICMYVYRTWFLK